MPLLDHFRPPYADQCPWRSVWSAWTTHLADRLNEHWLNHEFLAMESGRGDPFRLTAGDAEADDPMIVSAASPLWQAPASDLSFRTVFPETFEVHVFQEMGGRTLVGLIALVDPAVKKGPEGRRAFATRCASLLHAGVSVVILDVVTTRSANLYDETIRLMEVPGSLEMISGVGLYSVALRPTRRDGRSEIDVWSERCQLGSPLPTMPLRLVGDQFVPVELDLSYQETCRRRRLPG